MDEARPELALALGLRTGEDGVLAPRVLGEPLELERALPELEDVHLEVALVEHGGATADGQITRTGGGVRPPRRTPAEAVQPGEP